ncbi:MAG TPA: magnesium-translocating P-type ATPase [Candidatus Acidoferrales bacterium]|nr:magnesium-translocating P-type ATPase [Candidatus Acidoferrales bacterium]
MNASSHEVAERIRSAETPAVTGLSSAEAAEHLSRFGPNEAVASNGASGFVEFLLLFLNPLVVILLIASVASFALGDKTDAIIILVIVLLSISINFLQSYRSQRAIDRLREGVTSTATALRDGKWDEIKRREIVPGDIVRLSAGDLVPADAKLLESRDLYVQQAALTGESLPSEKDARAKSDGSGPDSPCLVFLGTSVVSGTAIAEVLATGPRTQFGSIANQLRRRPQETEFERSMRHFGLLITRVVFFLVLFIVVVRVAMHKDAFESFLFAVALAVGLTPEFLPMISTVTLARGAVRMARAQVVVKHLPAIQNLGTIDVFCSDKTGTLTTGQMILISHVDYLGSPSERVLELGYVNSKLETGIKSPLDLAVLKCECPETSEFSKCDEIPFDFERRRLSVVAETRNDGASRTMITKGAPEGIFPCCSWCEADGHIAPFGSDELERSRRTFAELSEQGFRVLAVAYRTIEERAAYSSADETGLTFAGYLAFSDPPNPDAAESLASLKRDGVEVKILTGDNELVARHVCRQVGLQEPTILSGEELDHTSDAALLHLADETTVFARVSPMQKHRIIQALRLRGHVVGYMGDGINDAPSLHGADVGISVSSAVDVARDAADIILLQPGLKILHEGIVEGRRASANVMKYVLMGTSSNFGNMFSMAAASVFLPFLPMLPTQVLLNNFLYDTAQITIPSDRVDERYTRRPRRWDMTLIRNFMIFIGPISSLYDFLTFFVLLYFFHAGQREFHTGWFVESLATQTLVLFVIRTMGNPLKSRPSTPLAITTTLVAAVACVLPFLPFATLLGFAPLPGPYFAFLAISTATYLLLVEFAKRRLFARADL